MAHVKARDNPEHALSRILSKFDTGDRHDLAHDLHYGFGLSISESYPAQLEAILGRDLSRDESFMVGVLHRIAVLQGFDGTRRKRGKVVTRAVRRATKKRARKTARRK